MRTDRHKNFRPGASSRGFSLIEMIGVIAIIAVLVAAMLPAWTRRIDTAVRKAEVGNLVTISNALAQQVLRSAPFHDHTTWTQSVADASLLPVAKVAANARRYKRLYYYETAADPAPGWVQTSAGLANPPAAQRAMVVTVLGGDNLDESTNWPKDRSGPLNSSFFDVLWDLPDNTKPTTGIWNNWNGRSDDLLIQRVNYAPLFHHLVLLNRDTNNPSFTINGSSPAYVLRDPNNAGWGAYYLHGSVVGLGDPNGYTMTRHVMNSDISFVWEKQRWRAEIMGAPDPDSVADDFAKKAKEFLEAVRSPDAFKGANQQGVVTCMYNFMLSYIFWANECPLFTTHGVSSEQVAEYRVLDAIGKNDNSGMLWNFSKNLVQP